MRDVTDKEEHYADALAQGRKRLQERFSPDRVKKLGAEVAGGRKLALPCLCWEFKIVLEPFSFTLIPGEEPVGERWKVLALEYLSAEPPAPPGQFCSFAEFEEARNYVGPFQGRVLRRLTGGIGRNPDDLRDAAEGCGGIAAGSDPVTYFFKFFPEFDLQLTYQAPS